MGQDMLHSCAKLGEARVFKLVSPRAKAVLIGS